MSVDGAPAPTLRIRPLPLLDPATGQETTRDDLQRWLFLDYGGGDFVNYDYRWAIERRAMPDFEWWGVIALSPTHVEGLPGIAAEIGLAQQAIVQLREQRAAKPAAAARLPA
jgi:hypothetical protein